MWVAPLLEELVEVDGKLKEAPPARNAEHEPLL